MSSTGLLIDALCQEHDTGPGHPESAHRYTAVTRALTEAGLVNQLPAIATRSATDEEVLRCHTKAYLDTVKRDIADGHRDLSTGDTVLSPRSLEVARGAAGGVLSAVDEVMSGRLKRAFCTVRPPGHHARPQQGMGFCVFNKEALGARHAQTVHGAAKILIVDWDVHHGNGTQDIFYEDGSVFFFSTHQGPWYPFTGDKEEKGEGKGKGSTMNRPVRSGAGMKEIGAAFQNDLLPAAVKFAPDLVMISAGFDSRIDDPLGQLRLTDANFAELTRTMTKFADEYCQGRLISVLEGGYNLSGLASAVTSHVQALSES